jgi:thiol-disulfide isomerase/thioredoxin
MASRWRPSTDSPTLLALICIATLLPACTSREETGSQTGTTGSGPLACAAALAEAESLASRHDAFIVVDFWHPACGPCLRFHQAVEKNAEVRAALASLVLLQLDVESEEAAREASRCGVHEFPTYQLRNARGELIDTWIGYHDPQWWLARLGDALADPVSMEERRGRFEENPNVEDALALGKAAFTRQRCSEAIDYLRRAQHLDPDAALAGDAPIFLFRAAYLGAGRGEMELASLGAIIEELLCNPHAKPASVVEVGTKLFEAIPYVGTEPVLPYLRLTRSVLPNQCEGEWEQKRQRFLVDYALIVEADTAKALALNPVSSHLQPQRQ